MPVVTPIVVKRVVRYFRKLATSQTPRPGIERFIGPSYLEVADRLERNQDPTGESLRMLDELWNAWLDVRNGVGKPKPLTKKDEQRADRMLRKLGGWRSDLRVELFESGGDRDE